MGRDGFGKGKVGRLARVVSGPGRAGQGGVGWLARVKAGLGLVNRDEAGLREVGRLAYGSELAGPDRGG